MVFAQRRHGGGAQALGQGRVVEGDRGAFDHGHRRHVVRGNSVSFRQTICSAPHIGQNLVSFGQRIGSQREAQRHLIGNDVAPRPAVNGAHGQHGRLLRIDLAADDGLRHEHKLRGEHDGVLAGLRRGAVSADAADGHIDAGAAGHQRSALDGNRTGGHVVRVMLCEHKVRPSKAFVKMVGEQRSGSLRHLLCWLADEHQRSVPLALALCQFARRAQKHGHVQVMAAGVRHADQLPLLVRGLHMARVVQPGLFLDRQSVQLRANQ